MLILSRKAGEGVQIGDHVTITVISVKGSQVRLGVAAPRNVEVYREEIFERVKLERESDLEEMTGSPRISAA